MQDTCATVSSRCPATRFYCSSGTDGVCIQGLVDRFAPLRSRALLFWLLSLRMDGAECALPSHHSWNTHHKYAHSTCIHLGKSVFTQLSRRNMLSSSWWNLRKPSLGQWALYCIYVVDSWSVAGWQVKWKIMCLKFHSCPLFMWRAVAGSSTVCSSFNTTAFGKNQFWAQSETRHAIVWRHFLLCYFDTVWCWMPAEKWDDKLSSF